MSELTNEQAIEMLSSLELISSTDEPCINECLNLAIQALRKADHVERIRGEITNLIDWYSSEAQRMSSRNIPHLAIKYTDTKSGLENILGFIYSLKAES